jgi:hypothetical protein
MFGCLIVLGGTAATADPLNAYVGGAVGRSNEVLNVSPLRGPPLKLGLESTGWVLIVGIRPILWFGAEIEYADFGTPSQTYMGSSTLGTRTDMHGAAVSGYGLFYLPLSTSRFGLYAKAGYAGLHSTAEIKTVGPGMTCASDSPNCTTQFYLDQHESRFAYGAGARFNFGHLGLRAEFERISASKGDPSLVSLGLLWNFHVAPTRESTVLQH